MTIVVRILCVLLLAQDAPAPSVDIDPALRSVVERFFETQAAEDADAYLALWSTRHPRPSAQQLKFIFDSGDDTFSDLRITHATVTGDSARVRVSILRARTDLRATTAEGMPRRFNTSLVLALSFVREDGEWRIIREGSPMDELAEALATTADPEARKGLMESAPDLMNVRLFDALGRRADPLARTGKFEEAKAIYERMLELARVIGDRKSEGQAVQNIGNALYYMRDYAGARAMYEQRLSIEREAANEDGIANALVGIATVDYSTYEYGAALKTYREALEIQERLDDQSLISSTLISTANVLYLQGDFDAAIADYRRAEALKRKYFDLVGATVALEGLGRVYSAQGDYAAALKALSAALEERRRFNDPRQAPVLQSVGEIHVRLGNTDTARTLFSEAKAIHEKAGDRSSVGRVLLSAALNELVASRLQAGETAYAQSIASCSAAKDPECIARGHAGLGFALSAQKKYDEAIASYRRAVAGFTSLKQADAAARTQVALAEALSGKGEFDAALKEAENARHAAIALDADDILWRALVSQARTERRLEHHAVALGVAKAAVLAVKRLAAAALERPGQAAPRDTTSAFATLAIMQAATGDAAGAFATAEEMRVHALRTWLAGGERDISKGMTDEERQEERALAAELTTLHVQRDRERGLNKPDKARLEKLDARIAEVTQRRAASQQALFERLPDLRVWRGLVAAVTVDELAGVLDDPAALLLEFVVDEQELLVLSASKRRVESSPVVERGEVTGAEAGGTPQTTSEVPAILVTAHVVPVEKQALGERIAHALDSATLGSSERWRKASAELFSIVPQPVVEQLVVAKRVYIAPDDVLWRVPFEAMPVHTGYLTDQAETATISSATALVRVPALSERSTESVSVLTIVAPAIPSTVSETLKATAPNWNLRPPEVSRAESSRLSERLPSASKVLAGEAATIPAFTSALATATAVHVAAPFRVNTPSPLFSRVLLAGSGTTGTDGANDGQLELRDLFRIEARASVVMLTDPAALSMRDAAASVPPVHWAWRAAGVPALLLRRWGGRDDAAVDFIGTFHEELNSGNTAGGAFRAAQSALRKMHPEPGAWAGWMLVSSR